LFAHGTSEEEEVIIKLGKASRVEGWVNIYIPYYSLLSLG